MIGKPMYITFLHGVAGLVPNITSLRGGSARRPPELSARAFALVASDPEHPSSSSWRRDVHPPRYSGRTILAIHF
jgi:hypothetical protein